MLCPYFCFPKLQNALLRLLSAEIHHNVLYKDDVSEEFAASTFIVEVKPYGGNSSDIGTMRPGPTGKARFPCVYLITTSRVGCGVTSV